MATIAIFDIGKTNKKFYLFNDRFQEIYRKVARFREISDEDGFPSDNLARTVNWIHKTLNKAIKKYQVTHLNFTTYGPALIHLNEAGEIIAPIYNTAKDLPKKMLKTFYKKHGGEIKISTETASPKERMKNAGIQLYWLKHEKPEIFKQIKHSLFLPQYLSYLFTGKLTCDYTCLGHHTKLWNFKTNDFHQWVKDEGIDKLFAPILPSNITFAVTYQEQTLNVGIGLRGSAAALLPYILSTKSPFLLLSTGDYNIALNPFNPTLLTAAELAEDCLKFMTYNGSYVKAARLYFGDNYKLKLFEIYQTYKKTYGYHKKIRFNHQIYQNIKHQIKIVPSTFEADYHTMIYGLVQEQIKKIQLIEDNTPIKTIYIEGAFANKSVFLNILNYELPTINILSTQAPYGTSIGAAMVLFSEHIEMNFLEVNFGMGKL